jgi:hypothetical protein
MNPACFSGPQRAKQANIKCQQQAMAGPPAVLAGDGEALDLDLRPLPEFRLI